MDDLRREIRSENGNVVEGFECGLCRIEDGRQVMARPHSFQLRQGESGREMLVQVCEKHYQYVENKASAYQILKRIL
jgi:hypothetical protein